MGIEGGEREAYIGYIPSRTLSLFLSHGSSTNDLAMHSLYRVLLTSPIFIPSCGFLAYGGLFFAPPVDGAGL